MNIAIYTVRSVADALLQPYLVIMLILVSIMLFRQNKKTSDMQKLIMGESQNTALELTISQIVIGIIAGTICSLILSYLGVIFLEESAISLIFVLSIVLMFWRPRFICFSYSGAILGLFSIALSAISFSGLKQISILGNNINLTGIDFLKIDIVSLVTLIGIIHLVEGFLVIIDGDRGALPVFTNRDEKIIGGFAFQRYWVLPIAVLLLLKSNNAISGSGQDMPLWWPLLKTNIPLKMLIAAGVGLVPFYGVLGYSNITFTMEKKKKTLTSGIIIALYGVLLTLVAQLARLGYAGSIFAVIFMPLAHEALLYAQRHFEINGNPKYVSGEDGIMVLDVSVNSPAHEMGIKSGDKLIEINNQKIVDEEEILKILMEGVNFIWFKIKEANGNLKDVSYNKMNKFKRLGIVFVPKGIPKDTTIIKFSDTKFSDFLDKFKKDNKDDDI
ncbi:MAG TPA: PDZ domain-containing protein [Clostridiaceae bacterium]